MKKIVWYYRELNRVVIPAKAGIQYFNGSLLSQGQRLDSCFRRNDELTNDFDVTVRNDGKDYIPIFYETIIIDNDGFNVLVFFSCTGFYMQ